MVDKEQLEYWEQLWDTGYTKFVPELLDYAKEQVKCAQKLEEYKISYEGVSRALDNMSEMLLIEEQQNKRYREGLKKLYLSLCKGGKYDGRINQQAAFNLIMDIEKIDDDLRIELIEALE